MSSPLLSIRLLPPTISQSAGLVVVDPTVEREWELTRQDLRGSVCLLITCWSVVVAAVVARESEEVLLLVCGVIIPTPSISVDEQLL
jgi:hypothetical protein